MGLESCASRGPQRLRGSKYWYDEWAGRRRGCAAGSLGAPGYLYSRQRTWSWAAGASGRTLILIYGGWVEGWAGVRE